MKPDLSIIIVSYNTRQITLSCIESIVANTQEVDYEIIVVDNGSTDGSREALKKLTKENSAITLVDEDKNLGFGKGNNLGASKAKGEYLLFLNSDTILINNALKEALDFVKTKKDLGVYSCGLLNRDSTVQPSGGYFPSLLNLYAWQLFIDDLPIIGKLIPSFHPHLGTMDKDREVEWVTGAFMIFSKKVFDKSGGFDEKIFMYTEEMEIIYRVSRLGYKTYFRSSPTIIHLGGASGGSHLALTSEVKNMLYFWKKHKPSWQLPLVKNAFIIGSLLRILLFGIIKGDEKSRRTYSEALKLVL